LGFDDLDYGIWSYFVLGTFVFMYCDIIVFDYIIIFKYIFISENGNIGCVQENSHVSVYDVDLMGL